MVNKLSSIFRKNRAEEFPDDLWNTFVFPVDYEQWNLLDNNKGVHVIGGRGTGKTMFLKYHCFPTQLSKERKEFSDNTLEQIGIYWRPDTHFVQLINEKYLKDKWKATFNTYVGLSLIIKFSSFLQKLLDSNYDDFDLKNTISELKITDILKDELKTGKNILYTELQSHCNGMLFKLQNWLHNPIVEMPILIDSKASLVYIINSIKEHSLLLNTSFHIFIDEFENLTIPQQEIVNGWLKHGEKPLLYSIAYKKYATISVGTSGIENLQRRNDHRIIDIVNDVYANNDRSFKVFASEIIASKLKVFLNNEQLVPISDRNELVSRRTDKYKKEMLAIARTVFPEKDYETIAKDMLQDKAMSKKIEKNIELALKGTGLDSKDFISNDFASATLVNSILLYRTKTNPANLKKIFYDFKENSISKSKKNLEYKELISNNVVASILYVYTYYSQRICPIYSGFDRFCLMSKSNIRHLLELCYQSFIELESGIEDFKSFHDTLPIVSTELQVKAAKFCSKQELETISELGPYGQDLQKIANRLGRIFHLKQRIKTQSKPENIHFSVETLTLDTIDEQIRTLITQAKIWNVLQEYDITKDTYDSIATKEYMLTPMLAPFYTISPRKIHKIPFTVEDLKTIFLENDEKFDTFYTKLIKDWKVEDTSENIQHSLFGDLF
jgi:hypothetical protein